MDRLDYFIYFVISVRILSILIGIKIEYHDKIAKTLETDNLKEGNVHDKEIIQQKKMSENNLLTKNFLDFLFIILFAIFIFITFKTGAKEVRLDFKKLFLLKFAAITLIANANWDSLFVFIHPHTHN
jgi:hypothetical protein